MKPKSALVHVAAIAVACTGLLQESSAKAPTVADSPTTTVALADIPTSGAYVEAMRWMSRGGLERAAATERSVGLASVQLAPTAFSRPRSDSVAESSRSDADLESWSLAAAALGMMVFIARRRLSD